MPAASMHLYISTGQSFFVAFFGTLAIDIAIAIPIFQLLLLPEEVFQLLQLLLVLLRQSKNYCS